MDIKQLNSVSPLRVFEEAINGGLGKGNLGVIVSRHGVGKTACLVHLATDKLFKGESVIHVSFSGNVEHVINWYKEVFKEIAEMQSLDDATMVYNSILANRVVMNFSQEQVKMNLEVWFSVSPVRPDVVYDEHGVPNTLLKYYDLIDVLVALRYDDKIDKVVMTVVRAHHEDVPKPMGVNLDPKTMLISK